MGVSDSKLALSAPFWGFETDGTRIRQFPDLLKARFLDKPGMLREPILAVNRYKIGVK